MNEFPSSEHIQQRHKFDMRRYISQLAIQRFDIDEEIERDNVVPIRPDEPENLIA
jgi:hypothetical protein